MKTLILFSLLLLTGCHAFKGCDECKIQEEARRWHAICIDLKGKPYYDKKIKTFYQDGGSVRVVREDNKSDLILGSCALEEL